MAALLPLPPALGVRVCACVCACDTATLQPSSIHTAKNFHPEKPGELGWVERGVGLGLAEEERDPLCSALPCPSLTPSGTLPRAPHPHVSVLFGGCSWF